MAPKNAAGNRSVEQPAVRTTIVGGRPPGSGKDVGEIPRGIEVLVKKASVDAEFKRLLLEKRAAAAAAIDLELDPAEAMMLESVPAAQLEAIIAHTTVSPVTRSAFLGRAAAVMLAALGAATGCDDYAPVTGVRIDRPPKEEPKTTDTPVKPSTATPPAKPKTETPAAKPKTTTPAAKPPEQPMMPVAGVAPRPIERAKPSTNRPVTKGVRPDRP